MDIRVVGGVSRPSFYRVLHEGMAALLAAEELQISFPKTTAEIDSTSVAFARASSNRAIVGCVGCVDGMLCKIKTLSTS